MNNSRLRLSKAVPGYYASCNLPVLFLLGLLGITDAHAANILVVTGTDTAAIEAGTHLNTDLSGTNTVTVVNTGVPGSLAGYTQIFDTRYDNHPAFTVGEQGQYLAFLNAAPGNTLFLMGENVAFNVRNIPVNAFIALAGGGTIAAPVMTVNGPETVNPPFAGPNSVLTNGIPTITYAACGLVTSSGTGAFATQQAGGGCAIYFGLGTLQNALLGALVVVYDVNFIATAPTGPAVHEVPFRLNLEQFASDPTTPPTVTSISPSSGSVAGGTAVTITGVGFTGTTGVTIGGTAATSITVVGDTSITANTPPGTQGLASVVVTTPDGINSANSLYTYADATPPPFQMYSLLPVNLQVVQNGTLIVSGDALIAANQFGLWQATTTTPWLTLNASAGPFPGVASMNANAAGLAVGTYNGSITVASDGQTLVIPVTLMVLAPQSLTANPAVISFASGYPAASATGYDIQIGPAGVAFTASTSADSSGWLTVSPASGVGPATIHVTIDPSHATQGRYQDTITIASPGSPNSPLSIPVTMAVSAFLPTLSQQVNSATGAGPDHTVAPNEIVSLSLSDFSCDAQPVVSLNGTPVAWSSYTSGAIDYAVPANVIQPSILSVACNGVTAWSFNGLYVAATIPGIVTLTGSQAGQAAAKNANGLTNGSAAAASRGSYVSVYVTGFGVFAAESADGLRRLAGTVTAQIDGVPTTVEYAGEAPENTDGLQQINLMVPPNGSVGNALPLMLWVNGTPTQTTATIAVQ